MLTKIMHLTRDDTATGDKSLQALKLLTQHAIQLVTKQNWEES